LVVLHHPGIADGAIGAWFWRAQLTSGSLAGVLLSRRAHRGRC